MQHTDNKNGRFYCGAVLRLQSYLALFALHKGDS